MKPTRLFILFYLALLGVELSYLFLLVSLLSGPIYVPILILLLYPLALFSRLALTRAALPHRFGLILQLALAIVVILVVAGERLLTGLSVGQVDVFGITVRMGLCGLTWWLGHTVPNEEVNYAGISFRFQMGILAMLVFSQVAGSVPPVLLFFLLAPLALFLARWASSFSRGASMLRPVNLSHLLIAGASVMVPGVALILLLSPDVGRGIVNWLGNISKIISDWLDAQHRAAANPPTTHKFDFSCNIKPEGEPLPPPTPPSFPSEGTGGISPIVVWIIVLAIFLAILALITFAVRKQTARRKARPIEPVWFQIRMVSLDMLRSLISLFRQLPEKLWLWLVSLFRKWKKRPKPSEEPLVSIRALYRNLLRWAAKQGVARAPAQTPLEHLELLKQRFPQQQHDLRQIIEVYLLARYSQKPISDEEFDSLKRVWQRAVLYY